MSTFQHAVVSPLEALKQPPVLRSPMVTKGVVTSHSQLEPEHESSDDDDIAISFPNVVSGSAGGTPSGDSLTTKGSSVGVVPSLSSIAAAKIASAKPKKRKKLPTKKILHVCFTKYPIIRELADELGFTMDNVDEELEKYEFNMIWSDTVLPLQKLVRLVNWQRTNHFPSMHLLCRKIHLGLTLGRMRKVFPQHYGFYPRTWSMRSERQQFARFYSQLTSKKVFILKPNASCQGKGIILTKDPLNATDDLDNFVCQEYVTRPLLIEGKKFDLRVYCLITSIRHLSIFIFNDGLVRMCAEDYEKPSDENMGNACKHLTNYAVNKHSEHFVFNADKEGRGDLGNKRDFVWLNGWFRSQGHSPEKFWDRVHHMIIKTVIAAQPQMTHVYNSCFPHSNDGYTCFEVLGFDILVDDRVKPVLMEVNHTPSFTCDTPLDHRIKHDLIAETWKIIDVQPGDKIRHQEREKAQFARRMQCTKSASSPMVPIDSMLSTAQLASNDQLLAGFDNEALLSAEQLAAEHRRKEDLRLKNYKRVYPSTNIEKQVLYETILAAAKTASAIPTTASQEQRQLEVKAEREKREQQGSRRIGTTGVLPSSSASSFPPESGRRPQRSAGGGGQPVPPQPPSLPASGNVTPTSNSDDILPSGPFVRSNLMPSQPLASQRASVGSTRSAVSGRTTSSNSGERPKRTKEEIERQRQKLAEQMERHRRRMVLGPRLSVFQLREAQLAAMFQEDPSQQQQQGNDAAGEPLMTHPRSAMSGAAMQGILPSMQHQHQGGPSSAPSSSNGIAVSGSSGMPSQQEQFQAILQQLNRYQQHLLPDYRFLDAQRQEQQRLQMQFQDHRSLMAANSMSRSDGFDLGDIEEDDDFGAGGGMYFNDEEEEE